MDRISKDTLEMLDEQIKKINKKGDISPSELEILCKAYELRNMLMCDEQPYDEGSAMYSDYGGHYMSSRRSPVTGRYVSRSSASMMPMPSDYGIRNSGHSIRDRIVACLEGMYDTATTEHERAILDEEIRSQRSKS